MSLAAFDNQSAFRALMDATARPGTIKTMEGKDAPLPLMPATTALVASLADFETPIWLDPTLKQTPDVDEWIRFATGAPLTDDPRQATFAIIADARTLPEFDVFAQGSEEYPDRSTTVIAQIESFSGETLTLAGPGLKERRSFAAAPLPAGFIARCTANSMLYPRGVDLILVAGAEVVALPRSVRISRRD